jgi:hypothetical protein
MTSKNQVGGVWSIKYPPGSSPTKMDNHLLWQEIETVFTNQRPLFSGIYFRIVRKMWLRSCTLYLVRWYILHILHSTHRIASSRKHHPKSAFSKWWHSVASALRPTAVNVCDFHMFELFARQHYPCWRVPYKMLYGRC